MAEPVSKTKKLPWREATPPGESISEDWIPFLRSGVGPQITFLEGELELGAHLDLTLIQPEVFVAPNVGDLPLPIFFQPRIDGFIGKDLQSGSAGLAVHFFVPKIFSVYTVPAFGMNHVEDTWSPSFDLTLGTQFIITDSLPQLYLESSGSFFDDIGKGVSTSLGIRMVF